MENNPNDEAQAPTSTEPTTAPTQVPKRAKTEVPEESRTQILRLHALHYGTRKIAPRVGLSRKLVRRVLQEEGLWTPKPPPERTTETKLESFEDAIRVRVEKGLTITRMLREIRGLGYSGGRTILAERVRALQVEMLLEPNKKTVKRRFETPLGEEMQIDWSPYRVRIGETEVLIHALGCLLCASRKLFLRFFRDERQSTLLEGLACAFEYFGGCTLRVVLDNMATAVLGRFGADGQPVWHSRFLDFAKHYGFTPFACLPGDSDRKGKKEKNFRLVEEDLIRGSTFASWDELAERTKTWLDDTPKVANLRTHGTTGLVPNEVWIDERNSLIQLPEKRFPVHEDSIRVVDRDSTLWVHGTPYTVPSPLANRNVAVRLYAEHYEVLDGHGRIAFSRRYVPDAEKGRLVRDDTHYANLPRARSRRAGGHRIDDAFVKRFPALAPFIDGLRLRMKSLLPIHIRALLRLADRFGEEAFVRAVERAVAYRRFDTAAVQNILEQNEVEREDGIPPLGGLGPCVLGEVEGGSIDSFAELDQRPSAEGTSTRDEDGEGSDRDGP